MKSTSRNSTSKISPARVAAFEILMRVERDASYASELLHSRDYSLLSKVDHSLTTELVMGVIRWRSTLDSQIAESSAQPVSKLDLEILVALRLGVYQLRWLSRVPARAAIYESVELVKRARKRSAAPYVNAVLRKCAANISQQGQLQTAAIAPSSIEMLASSTAHPAWLVKRWVQAYGMESALAICQHNQSVPVTSIRLRRDEAENRLRAEGIELAPGALLASARRVVQGDIARSESLREGLCAVQDEGSQLVAALAGSGRGILDCCAAPGGKTLALADRNPDAEIIAVELHPQRARLMQRLLEVQQRESSKKLGIGEILIVAADACALPFAATFNRILADVPCSGTGTLARNPEIKWRLKESDLSDLQARQLAILRSAMDRVADGGRLIYSTCSLEREENEDVVERALGEASDFRIVECNPELDRLQQREELIWSGSSSLTRGPYLRTLPGLQPCDGFFAAILERT